MSEKKIFLFLLLVILMTVGLKAEDNIQQLEDMDKKRKKTEILLNSAKKKENELTSRINQINDEEKDLTEEIEFVRKSIRKFGEEIEGNLVRKVELETSINEKLPGIKNYISYIYKRKNWDYSRIFFDSSSFNTFLKKYRVMKRVIKEELIFLDTVKTDLSELERANSEIEKNKEELIDFDEQLKKQMDELERLKIEKEELLKKVREEKRQLEEKYIEIERDYQKILAIINAENDKNTENKEEGKVESLDSGQSATDESLDFSWPVSEKRPVILPYGQQYNEYNTIFNNQGIDIRLSESDWIIAAENGQVAYKGEMSGLGKIIILKHSKEYTSVYTYLGDIFVRIGQKVTKGEKLASAAISSDNLEDPVFHFEIRSKGEPVNPEKFIKFE